MQIKSVFTKIKASLKKRIKKHPFLRSILSKFRHYLYRVLYLTPSRPSLPFERVIDLYSSGRPNLFFIEIGACDGLWHDPINKFIKRDKWRGILIEPVKYLFEELVLNYSSCENLIFENIAISDREGTKEFYYLAKKTVDNLSGDYKGLGTFRRELLSYLPPEAGIVSEKINCCRLQTLFEKHNVKRLDLLLIDTEGYDYSIIKQIDFNRIKPDILVYEHKHLNLKEYYDCIRYLKRNKYTLYKEGDNIMALSNFFKALGSSSHPCSCKLQTLLCTINAFLMPG